MSNVSVKLTWDRAKLNSIDKNAMRNLMRLGYDIASQARRNAPYQTGALRNTIRVQEADSNSVEVIAGGSFGGKKVPYAMVREKGPNKNPATEHYMENAQKTIMTGNYLQKYFGDTI